MTGHCLIFKVILVNAAAQLLQSRVDDGVVVLRGERAGAPAAVLVAPAAVLVAPAAVLVAPAAVLVAPAAVLVAPAAVLVAPGGRHARPPRQQRVCLVPESVRIFYLQKNMKSKR